MKRSAFFVSLLRMVTGIRANWRGCEPSLEQRIYFANHSSNLDALVIWASLPPEVRARTKPVAARDYWIKTRLRRFIAEKIFHAVLIERKRPTAHDHPIRQIVAEMDGGYSVIIFPEGGRFLESEPMPFKSGLFHLAQALPEAILVPVLIDDLSRILPKGEWLPVPMMGSVTFGEAQKLEEGEGKISFLTRMREKIIEMREV